MKLLDLFSGIGGFSLGAEAHGIETIGFVEKDPFCQRVLKKHWPDVPIESDIRNVKGENYGATDIISGGFPCQPFSVAGKQKGTNDDRYLWDETIRVIAEVKPRWFIGENVDGLVNIQNGMVLRQVQDDLEKEGFQVQCLVIPASGIGAWHQRKRVWIIGYSAENGNVSNTQHQRWSDQSSRGYRELGEESREEEKRGDQSALCSTTCSSEGGTDDDVSHTNNNGYKRGQSETRYKIDAREDNTSFRRESANNISGSGYDRGDKTKSRIDESVSRSHDGNQKESSTTKGLCDLSEKSNECSAVNKTSAHQENNDRTLVQERQMFQLSKSRGLGDDKTSSERDQIRSRDDNTVSHRVDTNHVSNTKSINSYERKHECIKKNEIQGQVGGESRTYNVSNTLGELSDGCSSTTRLSESKQEWMDSHSQEHKDKVWGETERCDQQTRSRGDVSNSSSTGLQGHNSKQKLSEQELGFSTHQNDERTRTWWQTESRFRGVPHGISYEVDKSRVNRIKSLGNSIVPQIAYQIFKSIVVAEEKK
jgi:DNA-cytosine methyltransferase